MGWTKEPIENGKTRRGSVGARGDQTKRNDDEERSETNVPSQPQTPPLEVEIINNVGALSSPKSPVRTKADWSNAHPEGDVQDKNNLDSPKTPATPEGFKGITTVIDDHSVGWTHVSKCGRGKHPRKALYK